jgi:LytS/YehU family sensor histidine kinase
LKNKLLPFSVFIVISVLSALYLIYNFDAFLHVSQQMEKVMGWRKPPGRKGFLDGFLLMTVLLVLGISTSLAVIQRWQRDALLREDMEKQQIRSELSFLKAQINPHFFFNTLNNIYSFTLNKSPQAPMLVDKLNNTLCYMINECKAQFVYLEKEIQSLKDYIELEKIRYGSRLTIQVEIRGDYMNKLITPLLMIPFIENSFKHGASETIGSSWINIDFSTFKENFIFKVENSKPAPGTASQNGHGIGLTNTRRRLELLYPGEHSIQILDTVDTYLVIVKIRMSKLREPAANANEVQVPHR